MVEPVDEAAGAGRAARRGFWRALDEAVPVELEVLHTVNVRFGPGKILIPDLAVITTPGADLVVNDARAVVMVVEITSTGNVAFDQAIKPQL